MDYSTRIFILAISCVLIIIFLLLVQRFKPQYYEKITFMLTWVGGITVVFVALNIALIEWPKLLHEQERQNEQRRLYFLELLTRDKSPNRIREEAFVTLLKDYQMTNFAGLPITNIEESYKTPFSFIECFRSFQNFKIDSNAIVTIVYDSTYKRLNKLINLDKLLLWNTDLRHADFSEVSQLRQESQNDWMVVDDEFGEFNYTFLFKYLTDTNLSWADLNGVIVTNGGFQNVKLEGTSLYNGDFANTYFENCDLSGADFTGANIDSVSFYNCKINENTKFLAVKNFRTIRTASPYIIHRIKTTQGFDKDIINWEFNLSNIENGIDINLKNKWTLWLKLKAEYPNTYETRYKERIKAFYCDQYGLEYDWEREL